MEQEYEGPGGWDLSDEQRDIIRSMDDLWEEYATFRSEGANDTYEDVQDFIKRCEETRDKLAEMSFQPEVDTMNTIIYLTRNLPV